MLSRERPCSALSLPTPAPLPSLTSALSRRAALFGAVASTGALAGSAAAAMMPACPSTNDRRLIELADAYAALDAAVNATHSTAPGYDALVDRYLPLEEEMAETAANSMAGVLAKARACQLQVLRDCEEQVSLSIADDVFRLFGGGAHA